jgi:pimeloyl-ACP methyl ester carboxylesterase
VIGHSLGAKVALELVRKDALDARRVTTAVVASALLGDSVIARLATSRALNRLSLGLMRFGPVRRAQSRAMGFPDESMRDLFQSHFARVDFAAFMRPLDAFRRYDRLPEGADAIRARVLVTCGEREPAAVRRSAEQIARAIPSAEAVALDGADHGYPWKRAAVFNRLVDAWVTRAALPSDGGFRALSHPEKRA